MSLPRATGKMRNWPVAGGDAQQLFFVSGADGRLAVGDQHDQAGTFRRPGLGQRQAQRLLAVGAAAGLPAADEFLGPGQVRARGRGRSREQGLGLGGKADDVEAVAAVQPAQAVQDGVTRLLQRGGRPCCPTCPPRT